MIAIMALQMAQENVIIGDVGYMYISENIDVRMVQAFIYLMVHRTRISFT